MSFFKNKHVITAMIVAPILMVGTYLLTDSLVKEKPQPAVAGMAYPLTAQSNCRYTSGNCDLVNGTFKSTVIVSETNGVRSLRLVSTHSLLSATIGFVRSDGLEMPPIVLESDSDENRVWVTRLDFDPDQDTIMRVALSAGDSSYYAESNMAFSNYETSFNKDHRK